MQLNYNPSINLHILVTVNICVNYFIIINTLYD